MVLWKENNVSFHAEVNSQPWKSRLSELNLLMLASECQQWQTNLWWQIPYLCALNSVYCSSIQYRRVTPFCWSKIECVAQHSVYMLPKSLLASYEPFPFYGSRRLRCISPGEISTNIAGMEISFESIWDSLIEEKALGKSPTATSSTVIALGIILCFSAISG